MPQAFLNLLAKGGIAFVPTDNAGLGDGQRLNFAPRFGVAVQATPRIVIHAGAGLFYGDYENYGLSVMPAANFHFNIARSYSAANAVSPLTSNHSVGPLSKGLLNVPLSAPNANLTKISLLSRAYNWKSAYTEGFNAQVQYQATNTTVLKLACAGSVSRHLQTNIGASTLNQILPATANAQTNSFFPDFARGGAYIVPAAATNYNGLQAEVTRQTQYLTLGANYTYSKCLGNARDLLDNDIGGYRAPWVQGVGIGADYALCDADVRNIFQRHVGSSFWPWTRLPDTWPGLVVRGRMVAAGHRNRAGWPAVHHLLHHNHHRRPGLQCAQGAGTKSLCRPHNAIQFLNPSAFANPVPGATGVAALGGSPTQVTGPAYRKLDLSAFRQIQFVERTRLELRAEAFNITNTPNFSVPGNLTFTTPSSFGQITSTRDNARQLQFAAKIYW